MLKCINNKVKKFQGRIKRRKRWLFHATDLQSLMYFNFTFCKILGIFPYKIKASTFEISKPRYILYIIITCAICVYELMMFYELNFSGRVSLEVPKTVTYNIHFILGVFITVFWYVSSGSRMHLLQTIQKISSRLPLESYQKLSKLIHAKDIFSCFFLLWQTLMLFLNSSEMAIDTLLEPLRMYIAMIVFQMDMLYMNCVCVLKACFKEINNNLENLRKFVVNDISRRVYHEQRNPLMLTKLKALKKQHLMVSDTVQTLNIIFSLQLLITIVIVFKQITFFLYFHIVQWEGGGITINLDKQISSEFFLSQIMYYLLRITLIVWACETGKNQAIEIGTTVHDVLNTTSDEKIKYELQLFSLQILHCNNTFSVKGFTVDATLLTTMVSSIVTYVIILTQFLGISHSCDEKTAINITEAI